MNHSMNTFVRIFRWISGKVFRVFILNRYVTASLFNMVYFPCSAIRFFASIPPRVPIKKHTPSLLPPASIF